MARFEKYGIANFEELLKELNEEIVNGSVSAKLRETINFYSSGVRTAIRAYEKISPSGEKRISMTMTLIENNGRIFVSLIAIGDHENEFLVKVSELAVSLMNK